MEGQTFKENREVLDAILWVLRTGVPWRDLPKKYPPYQEVLETCARVCRGVIYRRSIHRIKRVIVVSRTGLLMGRWKSA